MSAARKRSASNDSTDISPPAKARRTEQDIHGPNDYHQTLVHKDISDSDSDSSQDQAAEKIETMYLDTVNRSNLDFDFEQLCSVSLSNNNIYACLVCGKYFQGRGKQTHAYFHSINDDHHVFANLQTLGVYVLPDNYEVEDRSLNDIKAAIRPTYSSRQVSQLDKRCEVAYDLGGKKYLAGFIGLNKIKYNDYMNVVVQALAHVPPIRDALLLLPDLEKRPVLVQRLASLVRKIWHPKLFKAHVSPHELVQEVVNRSKRRFRMDAQGDAFEFLTWLLNTLHVDLGGSRKRNSSIVYRAFQGEIQVTKQPLVDPGRLAPEEESAWMGAPKGIATVKKTPFLTLSLDLPPKPLFSNDDGDDDGETGIPQVALVSLLQRYNGSSTVEWHGETKRYQLTELPQYIICHVRRFSKTEFSVEKNPTVVNFPIRNMPFGELLPPDVQPASKFNTTYDLVANICHDGQPEQQQGQNPKHDATSPAAIQTASSSAAYAADETSSSDSQYLVYLRHAADEKWYMMRDLLVEPIMPQMIFLSDSYIQIWQRNGNSNSNTKDNTAPASCSG
ncbi:U4 U6.U5 tri-snRNP-associated protein [Kickxella alabastrina]|uniref:U4 U6.U5 tri-snRNP-associated protein n=1 Tax=Kickxella alabastrina TaxID=61397 RepID=A0ACC1IH73_9FUNG|nr:U4 U6.U5 tri-snRNP-associated protein [Kickxella alabastrina]